MMFDFEEGFALFDMTPVDNQFIQEYLPAAPGDAVRVYLYGLMRCYHPDREMSPEQMGKDLNLTENEIMSAFRYWERRGLVQRIGDHPVMFRFISVRRKAMGGGGVSIDPDYEAFVDSLYNIFDHERRLHGGEIRQCYEWVEELKLPPEAVIMLLKHMEKKKGKNFSIQSADQIARQMADENVDTVEAAEDFLSRDQAEYEGTKAVLKRLGKRNNPSEDQIALYRKWTRDWGFTREAVVTACAETAKGDPSMGYLDGILRNMHLRREPGRQMDETVVKEARAEADEAKKMLKAAGAGSLDDEKLDWYRKLRETYPEEMILLAARESRGKPLETVEGMLASWKMKGIYDAAQARTYIREFQAQSSLMRKLREMWGLDYSLGPQDREKITEWEKNLGFTPEQILYAAPSAAGTARPLLYLNKILEDYAQQGIRTPEQMDQAREKHGKKAPADRPAKQVIAQQYEQRSYAGAQETPEEMMARLIGGK